MNAFENFTAEKSVIYLSQRAEVTVRSLSKTIKSRHFPELSMHPKGACFCMRFPVPVLPTSASSDAAWVQLYICFENAPLSGQAWRRQHCSPTTIRENKGEQSYYQLSQLKSLFKLKIQAYSPIN